MMNRQLQGRRIGSSIIQDLCLYLKETGLKRVLLGINKENPQSNAFWAKNGFSVIRVVEQEEGAILLAEKGL
jgi:ribosomal protein S18 acetylase RimI-like enzyme